MISLSVTFDPVRMGEAHEAGTVSALSELPADLSSSLSSDLLSD